RGRTANTGTSKAPAGRARRTRRATCARPRQAMRQHGSERSRPKCSASAMVAALVAAAIAGSAAGEEALRPYEVVGDAIPAPLTDTPGDAARGRAIAVNR